MLTPRPGRFIPGKETQYRFEFGVVILKKFNSVSSVTLCFDIGLVFPDVSKECFFFPSRAVFGRFNPHPSEG